MRKLVEVNNQETIIFGKLMEDWRVIRDFVGWCDSYTRTGLLAFNLLKNGANYLVCFERNKELPQYLKTIIIYSRFQDLKEIRDFINKKYKNCDVAILKPSNISKSSLEVEE